MGFGTENPNLTYSLMGAEQSVINQILLGPVRRPSGAIGLFPFPAVTNSMLENIWEDIENKASGSVMPHPSVKYCV